MSELFEQYIKSGLYLKGWSPKTAVIYKRAFTSFQQSLGVSAVDNPGPTITKAQLEAWIISRREAGMSPAGINIYIRAINAFTTWLKEEGHVSEAIVAKQLRAPQRAVTVFDSKDISLILAFKPRGFYELRTWTLLCLLLDAGCRIEELLTLPDTQTDLDQLMLTVNGKGSKQRKIPISVEVRKLVFKYFKVKHKRGLKGLVFCNRNGGRLRYRNVYRDLIALCAKVGITKRVHPHLTRHTFACHFIKNGGSLTALSRILGHSSVSTTNIYIRGLGVEDFSEEHARFSPLVQR